MFKNYCVRSLWLIPADRFYKKIIIKLNIPIFSTPGLCFFLSNSCASNTEECHSYNLTGRNFCQRRYSPFSHNKFQTCYAPAWSPDQRDYTPTSTPLPCLYCWLVLLQDTAAYTHYSIIKYIQCSPMSSLLFVLSEF